MTATNDEGVASVAAKVEFNVLLTNTTTSQGWIKFVPRTVTVPPLKGAAGTVLKMSGIPSTSSRARLLLVRAETGLLNCSSTVQVPTLIEGLKIAIAVVEFKISQDGDAIPQTCALQLCEAFKKSFPVMVMTAFLYTWNGSRFNSFGGGKMCNGPSSRLDRTSPWKSTRTTKDPSF